MASKPVPDLFQEADPNKVSYQWWWQFFRWSLNELQASSTLNMFTPIYTPTHFPFMIYTLISQPRWQPRILAAGWGTDDCLILLVVTFLLNPPASLAWGLPLHRPKKWLSHRPASEHLPFIHSVHQQTHMYLWGSQWLTSVILCSSEGDKLIHKPWGCSVVPAPRDTTMLCKLREEAPTPASSTLRGLPGEREAWCDESEKMNRN